MSPQGLNVANAEATNELVSIRDSGSGSQMLQPNYSQCLLYLLTVVPIIYYQCTQYMTVHVYKTRKSTVWWRLLNILNPSNEDRSEWEEHVTWEENPKLDSNSLLAERAGGLRSCTCTAAPPALLCPSADSAGCPSPAARARLRPGRAPGHAQRSAPAQEWAARPATAAALSAPG